jgi:predicted nucleic acid-binding protein
MKLIFDSNVVMDILAERQPFVDASEEAMAQATLKGCQTAITANAVTDLFFLLRKRLADPARTRVVLKRMVSAITILDATSEICMAAFKSLVADFEDAVLAETATRWSADFIVTKNARDFEKSTIKAITPDELLVTLEKV